jgi:tetratricopeptide (TPR) repeat protein
VLFYDKSIPEVYVEKAEIYIKLCDFSSAISCFKKALHLKAPMNEANHAEWTERMNALFFIKGLSMIEEGYCNDALNLVSSLQSEDVRFRYLNALACIRASNKELAFAELEKCLEIDPRNIECYIL